MIPAVDIVIPWVDGSDPQWQAVRRDYRPQANMDSSDARYREWDLFRYWFRSAEQYAPWVRKIHLVTWGHLPEWLNTENPRLHIVRHQDFIPREYLPTFSSHTIELNMHRIPGLSDCFIYFNDDVYLMKPMHREDFFVGGTPVDSAVMGIIKNTDPSNFMPYIMLNEMALINSRFSKRAVIRENPGKWFSPRYGLRGLLMNLYLLPWPDFTGLRNFHSCPAYRRETLEQVWQTFPNALHSTCLRKFRGREDVNQYLFRYWQLAVGNFIPGKPNCAYLTIGRQSCEDIENLIRRNRYGVVCINDDPMDFEFDREQPLLKAMMDRRFPEPCSFEKQGNS